MNDRDHKVVYFQTCDRCTSFSALGDRFYFVNDKKIITVMYRSRDRGILIEKFTQYLKAKERKHYSVVPFSN